MSRPHSLLLALLVALAGAASATAATAATSEDRKPIRLATLAPKGSSLHKALQAMGEALRAAPEGGVKLVIYPDGTMGGEAEMVRKMRIKQLQASLLTATGLAQIDPSISALQNMPLVYRNLEEVALVRERMGPLLAKRFEEKGFVLLFLGDVGWVKYFSKKPLLVPEDLQRFKIFTLPGDVPQVDLMKSLGLHPQVLEPADILTGLQTGLIDCVAMAPLYAQIGQFHKPAPYMLDLEWAPLVGGCVILQETLNALPPAVQRVLREAAKTAGEQIVARNRIENDESLAAMQQAGLKINVPSPAQVEAWRAWIEPIYAKLRGTSVQAELFDLTMETLREHRRGAGAPAVPGAPGK